MTDQTDLQLLRAYAESGSEAAYAELVHRHLDFVYSAALRMVRDAHLAEDVTQGVFVALAKSAAHLLNRPVLSGWLHRTAQNIAAQTVRTIERRRAREQEAVTMNELLANEPDASWEHIAPHLDAALGELNDSDRDALLLRYCERKSAREMAQVLGVSDEAAQKRVSRAVERLREFFAKRGVTVGASGLAVVISANAVHAAPVGLAVTISTATAFAGTTVAATAAATATKAIAMTTMQKTIIGATLAVAVGTGIYEARQASTLRAQVQTLQQRQAPLIEQNQQLRQQGDDATTKLAALRQENEQLRRATMELAKLRAEVARLREDARELAQLKASNANASKDPTESEMKSWLSRVEQLKQHLEQVPGHKIPELQFVTERDWLDAARAGLNTEADYRKALSILRSIGERKFVTTLLQPALKQYLEANNRELPTDLSQLQPFFKSPADDAVLQRWEVMPAERIKSLGMGGDTIISQKAAVDEVYDTRYGIGPNGWGSTDFLSSLTRDTMAPVNQAFAAANNGKFPKDLSELWPYATTPEQQAALQKLIQKKAADQ